MESSQKTVLGPINGAFSFKRHPDGTINKAVVLCNFCSKEFSYHRSTSSLKYHLNAKHFAANQEFRANRALYPSASSRPPAALSPAFRPVLTSQSPPEEEEKMDSSGQTELAAPTLASPPRRKRGRPRKQQVQREFSNIQRSQFNVLHRDLVVLRRSIGRMESRVVPLLCSISKSLERMADAFDYITSPATDGLLNSGVLNNTS